ncbi:23S rRNA (guanosine(2251)-2'-O)-methyltransferase RlmB [Brevundimonas sp. 2R-24]|uniref:23S rRNA (Guanosine(2251)-2'-O)-methyltransferase RlmB n=1 Tax=Peiella sedimenti TaxID=3061083 RepID=A0ABT8SPH7_9CAUL|nr:23S rRNA (guanosine(2251)-2'-O)-methyltransferase RlmB [Caulobacteraceae bacterium XZ-24]
MSSHRERNDRKSKKAQGLAHSAAKPRKGGWSPTPTQGKPTGKAVGESRRERPAVKGGGDHDNWVWGRHPVLAALDNPARQGTFRLVLSPEREGEIDRARLRPGVRVEAMDPAALARLLPQGAVHQGMALKAPPIEPISLAAMAEGGSGVILMLDQVTDPHNVGAIFRSAAAFGARGVIVQDRHAPLLNGTVAKASVGAVDALPHARVTNLSRALETLAEMGWRAVGLSGEGDRTLDQVLDGRPTVLVLGSEGDGIRRLVAEHCDELARIAMPGGFESLNVSNAAAIALYEASRPR